MLRQSIPILSGRPILAAAFLAPLLAALTILALSQYEPAQADTTFTVTKTGDSFDNQCDADCSLREAVVEANQTPGSDTIILGPGTYTLSIPQCDDPCSTFEEETTGDLDIRDNLFILGNNARNTAIDSSNIVDPADGTLADRSIDTIGAGALTVRLENLTIQGGDEGPSGAGSAADNGNGGGIRNRTGSTLNLFNVTVEDNRTTVDGGGIYSTGELNLEKVTINGNNASADGGGLFNGGAGEVDMLNVTISENAAAAASGGNIYNAEPGSTMSLLNVTVAQATAGDGITEAGGTVTLKNSLVVNNNANDCTNPVDSNGQNTDSDGTCGLSPAKGDTTDTTPGLNPLGNNGGQTDTHSLQPTSSAIDSADNNACPSDDQRNTPRPLDGDNNPGAVCDRGAYEYAECLGAAATIIGTEGNDNLTPQTTAGADVVLALGGNDVVDGKGSNDKICGGAGNDLVIGGTGNDDLDGEAGIDTVSYSNSGSPVKVDLAAGTATSVGSGNDTLSGFENATGGSAADKLKGDSGPNILAGGEGKDRLEGRAGNDILLGEGGNDSIYPDGGNDDIDGGSGTDNLYFKIGPVTVDARTGKATGEGNDDFSTVERHFGTPSGDTFQGDDQVNRFKGRGGNDLFFGRGGDDRLTGGAGDDTVDYGGNTAVIVNLRQGFASGQGNDTLIDLENVNGSSKADDITGNNGPNVLRGGGGGDSLQGLNASDDIFGEDGNDALDGGGGSDDCSGGQGTDTAVSCETSSEIP